METAERRMAIMRMLCRRRYEIVENIAAEFGVSERTIRRDIEILSLTEPIYTKSGRHGGGVYVMDDYYIDRMYFENCQTEVLKKLLGCVENGAKCMLSQEETNVLRKLISDHTKPDMQRVEKQ